jgi:peptide/nickel transport system ATP-binding protein
MYAGRVIEHASTEAIFNSPEHPYTWGLIKSIPRLDSPRNEQLVPIPGRPPSLITLPGGCSFHPRCPYVRESHKHTDPQLEPVPGQPDHTVACLLASDTRKRMWAGLSEGQEPGEVRHHVELEEEPA